MSQAWDYLSGRAHDPRGHNVGESVEHGPLTERGNDTPRFIGASRLVEVSEPVPQLRRRDQRVTGSDLDRVSAIDGNPQSDEAAAPHLTMVRVFLAEAEPLNFVLPP